jgi:hypothetical protein
VAGALFDLVKEHRSVIPKGRIILASIVVGLLGAVIGGLWGNHWANQPEASGIEVFLPAGIISGFLSCFFVSMWYLKFMQYRSWQQGILFGPLFAALAGATSAVITGISVGIEVGYIMTGVGIGLTFILYICSFGLLIGSFSGAAVGLILSIIFGPFLLDWLKK